MKPIKIPQVNSLPEEFFEELKKLLISEAIAEELKKAKK